MNRRALALLLLGALLSPLLSAGSVAGRITDGRQGLAGVRVYPDRLPRVSLATDLPVATTDAEGRFHLDLPAEDTVLAVEKEGWRRDLVPATEWGRDVVLHPEPDFRREAVYLVRLDFPDEPSRVSDEALRALLFSRRPGQASAANYLYEVSKGTLLLEEGRLVKLRDPEHPTPRRDEHVSALSRWVLEHLQADWGACDRVDNRSGAPRPDGKPDHLWIVAPGHPQSVTGDETHIKALSLLLPWRRSRLPLLFLTEEVPLGNIVHEAFHSMGEHCVDDLYLEDGSALTAGIWDLMDGGQYRGWDRNHPGQGPLGGGHGLQPLPSPGLGALRALVPGSLPLPGEAPEPARLPLGRLAGPGQPRPRRRAPVAHGARSREAGRLLQF